MRPLQQPGAGPARELPTPADEVGLARVGAVAVEQDLGPDGPEPGRLDHPQGGGVAGRDLGEQHLAGRDQVAGGRDQQPPQPAVAPGRVDLEGDLPAPGQPPPQQQHPGPSGVGPDLEVAAVAQRPGRPRVPGRAGPGPQLQRRGAAPPPPRPPPPPTPASPGPWGPGHPPTTPPAAGGDPGAAPWSSRNSRWLTPRAYRVPAAPP